MNVAAETTPAAPTKTAVFDESGITVEETEVTAEPVVETAPETPPVAPTGTGRYRIGDKMFETQEAALDYANKLEAEASVTDAYRQGLRDAGTPPIAAAESVTPVAPVVDTEELYTNPAEFLRKRDEAVKTDVLRTIESQNTMKAQSDSIWREFTEQHPMLADFRGEVEEFVRGNQTEVRALIATKGRPASYDFIATKIKSRFEKYANAVKPKRELPNGGASAPPTSKGASVIPKADAKKPLSFAEQLRSIRQRR